MVWLGGGIIIVCMTVKAFHPQRGEVEQRGRSVHVAVKTIGGDMGTHQREPALLVHLRDVIYNP